MQFFLRLSTTFFGVCLLFFSLQAQAPFISDGPGEGLGQYGYLEVDATTHVTLNSNTYGNIHFLHARWWTGAEYIYNTNDLSCGGSNTAGATPNYNMSDLTNTAPGDMAFVSARATYCFNNGDGNNYNERQFRFIDIEPDNNIGNAVIADDDMDDLVGSFTLDAGGAAVILNRLFIQNDGTAQEGNDLPNDAFKVYYEPITGSEVFNGDEANQLIYGDYGGGPTNDNIYGHDLLNISIPPSGLRVYVTYNDSSTTLNNSGETVNLSIINDGISLSPSLDNHDLLRVGQTNISNNQNVVLFPVEFISFSGHLQTNNTIKLTWTTATEFNASHFEVQKYMTNSWQTIGNVSANNASFSEYTFIDADAKEGFNRYRLKQVDLDGGYIHSNAILIEGPRSILDIQIYPTLARDEVGISLAEAFDGHIQVVNSVGQVVDCQVVTNDLLIYNLNVANAPKGIYFIQIIHSTLGILRTERIIKQE